MQQVCEVYRSARAFFVVSFSQTVDGIWVGNDVRQTLAADSAAAALGQAVLRALDASRQGQPRPADVGQPTRDLLRFVGAKSWTRFANAVQATGVRRHGPSLTVTAYERGEHGAFLPRADKEVTGSIEALTDAELGARVLEALGQPIRPTA